MDRVPADLAVLLGVWFVVGIVWGWKRAAYSAVYAPALVSFAPAMLGRMRPEVPALAEHAQTGLVWASLPVVAALFGALVSEAVNPERRDRRGVKKAALSAKTRLSAADEQINLASRRIEELLSALPSPAALAELTPVEAAKADKLLQKAAEDVFVQRMRISTATSEVQAARADQSRAGDGNTR